MNLKQKLTLRAWVLALSIPIPLYGITKIPKFIIDYLKYKKQVGISKLNVTDTWPCLWDSVKSTNFDSHYFFQGAWLARKIKASRPVALHVDIGSSVMCIGVLSAFVETVFVDYRPLNVSLLNLNCIAGDITALSFDSDSVESLSCLHVIEHIGLGRYGDPIDHEGSIKAAAELERVVKPGGKLYISTPVGMERICFNAHRIFDPLFLCSIFPKMDLISFAFVDDMQNLNTDSTPEMARDLVYGCGFFEFRKKSTTSG